jgi:WD40 repeat protein/serine/threonine protein kinase
MPTLFDQLLKEPDLLAADQLKELRRLPEAANPDPRALGKVLLQRNWLTKYQINEVAQGRGKGLKVGPYLLVERLGEGGMGQVFKARHLHMGRVVALKLMRKEKLSKPDSVRRFYQEVTAAAALVHPNIVLAFDAGQAGNTHFFSMEYVDGPDLARLVKERGPLPVAQACEYIRQAAVGLQHAHERGLVHRDIKPSNLLVTTEGSNPVVKILDMGLARLGDPAAMESHLTRAGQVLGTPDYLAPEQALDARSVDIRADIYSLGCSLYYLLTGRPPFKAEALAQLLLKHQMEKPPSVRALRPDVPEGLDILMQRMMAKKPEQRPATPAEIAYALGMFTGGQAAPAGIQTAPPVSIDRIPPPPPAGDTFTELNFDDGPASRSGSSPRLRKRVEEEEEEEVPRGRRRDRDRDREEKSSNAPILIGAGVGAGVVLLGGAILAAVLLSGPGKDNVEKDKGVAVDKHGKKHEDDKDKDTKGRPIDDEKDKGKGKTIVIKAGTGKPVLLRGHTGPVRALAVSPDGKLAASGGLDRSVLVWDLANQKELRRIDGLPGEVWSLRFAPDNRRLFVSSENSLFEHDVVSGKKLGTDRSPGGHVCPDGKTMLSFDTMAGRPVTRFLSVADMSEVGRPTAGLTGGPYRVSFDAAGANALVFGEPEEGLHLDLVRRSLKGRLAGEAGKYRIVSTCWGPGPQQVLLGCSDGSIRRISLDNSIKSFRIGAFHEGAIRSIDLSPDGSLAASTCDNVHVYLTDVQSRQHAGTFTAHRMAPNKVLFCLGGKRLISAGEDNQVILWETDRPTSATPPDVPTTPVTPKEVRVRNVAAACTIPAPPGSQVAGAAYAAEGPKSISAMGPLVLVHDLDTARLARTRKLDFPVSSPLVLTKDRKRGLAFNAERTLVVFDIDKDEAPKPMAEAHETTPLCLAVSPNGKYALSGAGTVQMKDGQPVPADTDVRLWGLAEGKVEHRFTGSATPVVAVAFTDDGKYVLASSQDTPLRVWELESKKLVHTLGASPTLRPPVRIAPAGNSQVLLGSADGSVRLFDCEKGSDVKAFKGKHEGAVAALALSPDQKFAFTVGGASRVVEGKVVPSTPTMRMWDVEKGVEVVRVNLPGLASSLDVSPDGKGVLISEASAVHHVEVAKLEPGDGSVPVVVKLLPGKLAKVPVPRTGKEKPYEGHKGNINSVVFSRDGKHLLSAGLDGTAKLWDATSGALVESFTSNDGPIQLARFGRRDRSILAIGEGPTGHLWTVDAPDQDEAVPYPGKAQATCGDISSDGKTILLGGLDTLQTITLSNGKVKGNVEDKLRATDGTALGDATAIVALGPPQLFAIGTSLGVVAIWNTSYPQADGSVKGQVVHYWKNHQRNVLGLACAPKTMMIASVSADKSIVVRSYDPKKLKAFVREAAGHGDEVTSVAFSPNGVYVATGGRDRTVRFWTHTGVLRQVNKMDINGEVLGVAYSPDGKRIAVCGKAIRVHSLEGKKP